MSKRESGVSKDQFVELVKLYLDEKMTKKQIKNVLDAAFTIIKDSISMDGKMYIHNFGTFSVVKRSPRKFTLPNSHRVILSPERKRVIFKPTASFKTEINS